MVVALLTDHSIKDVVAQELYRCANIFVLLINTARVMSVLLREVANWQPLLRVPIVTNVLNLIKDSLETWMKSKYVGIKDIMDALSNSQVLYSSLAFQLLCQLSYFFISLLLNV